MNKKGWVTEKEYIDIKAIEAQKLQEEWTNKGGNSLGKDIYGRIFVKNMPHCKGIGVNPIKAHKTDDNHWIISDHDGEHRFPKITDAVRFVEDMPSCMTSK
jgi:hypothetical protein